MLRIHFTCEDLTKVVFNDRLLPACEAVLGLQMLLRTDQRPRYGQWRARLQGQVPASVRPLRDLVAPQGWIPDFLTPVLRDPSSKATLDAIKATPRRKVRAEITRLSTTGRRPGWLRSLADADTEALTAVTEALDAWNRVAIRPHEAWMQAALDADMAQKSTTLAQRGLDTVFRRLHPAITWRAPVLTLPSAIDADVDLAGRGLCLTPMVFCGPLPRLRVSDDSDEMPALAYPLSFDSGVSNPLAQGEPDRGRSGVTALERLLGGTRSTILHAIVDSPGLTTAGIAQRANVAMATASEHATVLREAGLVISHRDGPRVRHYATATAAALLAGRARAAVGRVERT